MQISYPWNLLAELHTLPNKNFHKIWQEYISKSYVHSCANFKPLCKIMVFKSPTNHPVAWILSLSNHFKFRYLKKVVQGKKQHWLKAAVCLVWNSTTDFDTDRIKLWRVKWDKCVVLEDDDHTQKIKHKHSPSRSFLTDIPATVLKESCISVL